MTKQNKNHAGKKTQNKRNLKTITKTLKRQKSNPKTTREKKNDLSLYRFKNKTKQKANNLQRYLVH